MTDNKTERSEWLQTLETYHQDLDAPLYTPEEEARFYAEALASDAEAARSVDLIAFFEECSDCDGSGEEFGGDYCDTCDGEGLILVTRKARPPVCPFTRELVDECECSGCELLNKGTPIT